MKKILAISILLMSAMVLFPVFGNAQIVSGNWYLQASSKLPGGGNSQIPQIGASFTQSGTLVSGVLHISDSKCFDWGVAVPVSGTVDGTSVSLTATGDSGGVITITGSANSNIMTGNYNIQSGCANGDYGTFTAVLLSPASGNWTGSATSGNSIFNAAASLSQVLPNSDGFSLLSGTVSFSGTKCNVSGTLVNDQSWVLGNMVLAVANLSDGGVLALNGFVTDTSTSANKITLNFSISGGTCAGKTGSVSFTRQ